MNKTLLIIITSFSLIGFSIAGIKEAIEGIMIIISKEPESITKTLARVGYLLVSWIGVIFSYAVYQTITKPMTSEKKEEPKEESADK